MAGGRSKAQFLADVLNNTLYTLGTNCAKADGIRDYFAVGVIAYSGSDARNGFQGTLGGSTLLHSMSTVAANPLRVEDRVKKVAGPNGDLVSVKVKFPVWFEPRSQGRTSMCAGFALAADTVRRWCVDHSRAYPPTVLHVTDGHPTDGDPETVAATLRGIATEDGACLVFNLHVDVGDGQPVLFPSDEAGLRDRFAKSLFRMSSYLPPSAVATAASRGIALTGGARGFIFNASAEAVVDFFDIGTRPSISLDR